MASVELLELAENANAYTPLGSTDERDFTDRYVLWMGRADEPGWNVAQRFRLRDDEVDEVRSEIHARLHAKGRTACTWEVGTNATPPDLVDRLLERGLVDDSTPLAVGMVLTEPPTGDAPDVLVRRATTPSERLAAASIASVAFGIPEPECAPDEDDGDSDNVVYVAYVDGEPVARATASFSEHGVTLFGGATLPEARGRGAYRALVAARWEDAVRRGTPALVTQASPMSRPILRRLGFREVCEIRILLDAFGRDA
jgi:GNAT superfamily N-acetyltransferase